MVDPKPPPTQEAMRERVQIVDYLRKQAEVWMSGSLRLMNVRACDIGRQLDLVASELVAGAHWISDNGIIGVIGVDTARVTEDE